MHRSGDRRPAVGNHVEITRTMPPPSTVALTPSPDLSARQQATGTPLAVARRRLQEVGRHLQQRRATAEGAPPAPRPVRPTFWDPLEAPSGAPDGGSAPRALSSRPSVTDPDSPQRASCDEPYAERYSHLWDVTPVPGVASRRTSAALSRVFQTRAETRSMAAKKKRKPRGSPGGRVRPPDGEW